MVVVDVHLTGLDRGSPLTSPSSATTPPSAPSPASTPRALTGHAAASVAFIAPLVFLIVLISRRMISAFLLHRHVFFCSFFFLALFLSRRHPFLFLEGGDALRAPLCPTTRTATVCRLSWCLRPQTHWTDCQTSLEMTCCAFSLLFFLSSFFCLLFLTQSRVSTAHNRPTKRFHRSVCVSRAENFSQANVVLMFRFSLY